MKHFALICGVKNSGKTTLTEKIVRIMSDRGLRVAVLKHDGHDFECDIPGTDSWRFAEAGACGTAVFSRRQLFLRRLGEFPDMGTGEEAVAFLRETAAAFPDADVILGEGFKGLPLPKVEVVRSDVSRTTASNPEGRFLIVSDLPEEHFSEPTLSFTALEKITDTILEKGSADFLLKTGETARDGEQAQNSSHRREAGSEMPDFTHFDENGMARMVDVGEKNITRRTAVAEGRVLVNAQTFALIRSGGMKKGDVLGTAQVAGIMGAKRTPDLIPMCHPILIDGISLTLTLNEEALAVDIRAEVSCAGRTGVEMEALTAVSTAALTVYDMCKAVQRDMEITGIRLVKKTGGVHGDYQKPCMESHGDLPDRATTG